MIILLSILRVHIAEVLNIEWKQKRNFYQFQTMPIFLVVRCFLNVSYAKGWNYVSVMFLVDLSFQWGCTFCGFLSFWCNLQSIFSVIKCNRKITICEAQCWQGNCLSLKYIIIQNAMVQYINVLTVAECKQLEWGKTKRLSYTTFHNARGFWVRAIEWTRWKWQCPLSD